MQHFFNTKWQYIDLSLCGKPIRGKVMQSLNANIVDCEVCLWCLKYDKYYAEGRSR